MSKRYLNITKENDEGPSCVFDCFCSGLIIAKSFIRSNNGSIATFWELFILHQAVRIVFSETIYLVGFYFQAYFLV